METDTSIPNVDEDIDSAVDALLSKWTVKKDPSEDGKRDDKPEEDDTPPKDEDEAPDEETDEEPEDQETDEESQDDDEDKTSEEKPKKRASDDDEVEVTVDGKTITASVKDLKRLYGQEASLTRKSQETAAIRKQVEQQGMQTAAVLQKMHEAAVKEYEPYSKIDFFKAMREMDSEEFDALRQEATKAYEKVKFFDEEIKNFFGEVEKQQSTLLQEQAKAAVPILRERIPDWSVQLYDDLRTYAVSEGMDADIVNRIVDPAAITLLHKAYLYDKAEKAKKSAKAKMKDKPAVKSKAVKSDAASPTTRKPRVDVAMKKLQTAGDIDSAAEALMARWRD